MKIVRLLIIYLRIGLVAAITCQTCPKMGYYTAGCDAVSAGTCAECGTCGANQGLAGCTGLSNGTCMSGINSFALIAGDWDSPMRKIDLSTAQVTTVPYTPSVTATSVLVSCDGTYAFFVHTYCIKKVIIETGALSDFVGLCGTAGDADGSSTAARFRSIGQMKISNDCSYIIFPDRENQVIRKAVISTAAVTTIAGIKGTRGNTNGAALGTATIYDPRGIAFSPDESYVLITEGNRVRKLTMSSGVGVTVSLLAGDIGISTKLDGIGFTYDGVGQVARFNLPLEISISSDGIFAVVADFSNSRIRKVVISTATVSTLATVTGPRGISILALNNFAIVTGDRQVFMVSTSTTEANVIAGTSTFARVDGRGTNAAFTNIFGNSVWNCKRPGYGYGQYYDICSACPPGKYGTAYPTCTTCGECGNYLYETQTCTSTTNVACGAIKCTCDWPKSLVTPCGVKTDAVCTTYNCNACQNGKYKSTACTISADRICTDCPPSTCNDTGYWQYGCDANGIGTCLKCTNIK